MSSSKRRVRFKGAPIVVYPSTPSSPVVASAGPSTPQAYYYPQVSPGPVLTPNGYQYPGFPVPYQPASPVYVVKQMTLAPGIGRQPLCLSWDIRQDPCYLGLKEDFLDQPATTPVVSQLTIRVICLHYPWSIVINIQAEPLRRSPFQFVTIRDVMYYLHRDLHIPVTKNEWRSTKSQIPITAAFQARTGRLLAYGEVPCRIDFLMDAHFFCGISLMNTGNVMSGGVVLELLVGSRI